MLIYTIEERVMARSSYSSIAPAVAILAIIFICCSLPCSAALQVQPDGIRGGFGPPSPQPGGTTGCRGDCHHGQADTNPRAMEKPALAPQRKTLQQSAVTN